MGNSALTGGADQWTTDNASTLTDIAWLTSKFNNRFRSNHNGPGTAKINDLSGYVTGQTLGVYNANRATNMSWFGGCYFKPAKQFEDYFNDLTAARRWHNYAVGGATATLPDTLPDFKNRHMSGVATYRCTDTAPGTSAVPITTTLVNCEVTAKA